MLEVDMLRTPRPAVLRLIALCAVAALTAAASPAAQAARSTAAAAELGQVLERLKLDSIAAADPSDPNTFVAALYFPGSTLLVVSAKYSVPSLLAAKIAKKDYRDAYIDLNAASIAGTKVFVMDQGADGLLARPGDSQAPDSWEQGSKTVAFDGDWRAAKMSEDDYAKVHATADEQYARILSLLADEARKAGGGS